jgi:hypothetical protein
MSDPNLSVARDMKVLQDTLERLRKADVPALYPPWTQGRPQPVPARLVRWRMGLHGAAVGVYDPCVLLFRVREYDE